MIDWNGNQIEDRDYNALGQLTQIARPGFSQPEIRAYDGRRLTTITTNTGVGTATYNYDANHNKTGETWTNNSILDNYDFDTGSSGYDAEDRFLEFNRPNMAGGAENQSFDRSAPNASIGNIVGITGGDYAGTRSFNNIHQLKDVGTSAAVTQDFDSFNGNLTKSYSGTTFGWDIAAGRMTSATVSGDPRGIDGAHQYGYDATGRRAWKSVDDDDDVQTAGVKTICIYSGPNLIAEYNSGSVPASPGNEYVYSGRIDSLAMVAFNNNAQQLGVNRNQQWSVAGLVNLSTQAVEELYSYNVFGERTILDPIGGTVRASSSFNNRFGYTSREHDDETGMMYFRARCYDPTTGEFISTDPLGYVDGMSQYRGYFGIDGIDPLGLTIERTITHSGHWIFGMGRGGRRPWPGTLHGKTAYESDYIHQMDYTIQFDYQCFPIRMGSASVVSHNYHWVKDYYGTGQLGPFTAGYGHSVKVEDEESGLWQAPVCHHHIQGDRSPEGMTLHLRIYGLLK